MSDRAVAALRISTGAAGILLLAFGLFGDAIGTSSGHGFGRGQAVMCCLGALLVTAALLGRAFPAFWRRLALVLANAAVLLALLELAALGLEKAGTGEVRGSGGLSGDHPAPLQLPAVYQPYVGWRSAPGSEPGMTVGEDGLRLTPGASDDPDAFTVFVTGGSTVWGFGLDDSSTIPALLQQNLSSISARPVRVVNLGQVSWVSTQCLIETILRLQAGDRPDLVIVYGGFNDINSMRSYGCAGLPFGVEKIRALIERSETGGAGSEGSGAFLRSSALYRLVSGGSPASSRPRFLPDDASSRGVAPESGLVTEALEVWEFNCSLLDSLGRCFGFETAAFWEPVLAVAGGERTEAESRLLAAGDPVLTGVLRSAWGLARDMDGTFYLGNALDGFEGQAFTDEVHLTEDAARVVAGAMTDSLLASGLLAGLIGESAR
ncbi:SGNH/GDSL hydrolase family protein [Candidatus Fermentibacteria bacterium]|nr:SGNH/GDSL hydrolase family protein [Candidatus Fermentibacteria bacterium]